MTIFAVHELHLSGKLFVVHGASDVVEKSLHFEGGHVSLSGAVLVEDRLGRCGSALVETVGIDVHVSLEFLSTDSSVLVLVVEGEVLVEIFLVEIDSDTLEEGVELRLIHHLVTVDVASLEVLGLVVGVN